MLGMKLGLPRSGFCVFAVINTIALSVQFVGRYTLLAIPAFSTPAFSAPRCMTSATHGCQSTSVALTILSKSTVATACADHGVDLYYMHKLMPTGVIAIVICITVAWNEWPSGESNG